MNNTKKYHIFLEDLDKIKDKSIKRFTESALEATDDKFYTAPASSSGKYHPAEDNGVGGLVRHVKKGLYVVEQYARRAQFSQTELDIAYSAFMLHDSCKDGVVWGEHTDYTHGFIASEWLKKFKMEDKFAQETLLNAVRYHMAPWVYLHVPWTKLSFSRGQMEDNVQELQRALTQPTRVELAVREADYWSSRSGMSYLPGLNIVDERHDMPELEKIAERYNLEVDTWDYSLKTPKK